MKLPVDGIEAFIHVAELESFQKAAEQLFLSQTGLSRRIQRLEEYVGLRLVDRTTRFVGLTQIGREFLPQAKRMLEDLTLGLDRLKTMSRLASGEVTIACLQTLAYYQLPVALRAYSDLYPTNRVRVLERTGVSVTDAVRHAHAEFGLHIMISEDQLSDLVQEKVMSDPMVLFCLEDDPVSHLPLARWADLGGRRLITLGGASANRRAIEEQLERAGLDHEGRYVVENFASAVGLVAAGLGVAVLPASMGAANQYPMMRQVPLAEPTIHRAIGLVRRRDVSLTPAASELYRVLKNELSAPYA